MWKNHQRLFHLLVFIICAAILRFVFVKCLSSEYDLWIRILGIISIIIVSIAFILRGTANIIEETTEVLSERTKIAGGLLQSLGTAFPDMVLGIIAAILSLNVRNTSLLLSVRYAVIAAAATFGSNIYNIAFAVWCIFRQNVANTKKISIDFIPGISQKMKVIPIKDQSQKPTLIEFDSAIDLMNILSILTAVVAISMVIFGQVNIYSDNSGGTLYQLIQPIGIIIILLSIFILYHFRSIKHAENPMNEVKCAEKYFSNKSNLYIWLFLGGSGLALLMTAESMIHAIQVSSEIFRISPAIVGFLAGLVGSLGEMIVIYDYTVHPKGKMGDAVTGIAMDNIITILGAAIVAAMGGIFLGSNALIIIFVVILTLNTMLIWQISKLKNYFLVHIHLRG
jgi:hypothetical protein